MAYRPNYGNSYIDTNNRLGYSNVSKTYGAGYSNKSILLVLFQIMVEMIRILEKLSLCFKTKEKSSKRQKKNMNTIWTMREK